MFYLWYSADWPNFIVWLPLLCEILSNIGIAIACKPGCDVMNFQVNLNLFNQAVFHTWPKCRDKNLNILRMERAFKMKWKAFFIIFKGLSINQIIQIFLEGETLIYFFKILSHLVDTRPKLDIHKTFPWNFSCTFNFFRVSQGEGRYKIKR